MLSMSRIVLVLAALVASAVSEDISGPKPDLVKTLKTFPGFKAIYRTNATTPSAMLPIGTIYDKDMKSLGMVSNNPDFNSIHLTKGGNIYMLSQFESPNPAAFYVTKLSQDSMDGTLTPIWFKPVDFSKVGGLWTPCAGSITPSGSHAGGEEYEPDALCFSMSLNMSEWEKCMGGGSAVRTFLPYLGMARNATFEELKLKFQPYNYGYPFEVTLMDEDGNVEVAKHYSMGRHSYEMWTVMPDAKTAYSTDDGTNTAFYKYIADMPNNFSCGNLYGAKFIQQSDVYGGDFVISWIYLGHSSDSEILVMINNGITFSDIFGYMTPGADGKCASGYKMISARDNGVKSVECLMLKAGMQKAAATLEARRYLAYLGGSVELSKFEGITYDPITKKLYSAMSQIRYGMEDNKKQGVASTAYDLGGSNDIRLPYNPCGCVYACDMTVDFDCTRMYGEVCGAYEGEAKERNLGVCDVGGISEPDNVAIIPGQATILIGEDTGTVENDAIWQYDLHTKMLKRIFTTPLGSETTSPYVFGNINGWTYISAAVQHPYGESAQDQANAPESTGTAGWYGAWAFNTSELANGSLQFEPITPPYELAEKHKVRASAGAYITTRENYATLVATTA